MQLQNVTLVSQCLLSIFVSTFSNLGVLLKSMRFQASATLLGCYNVKLVTGYRCSVTAYQFHLLALLDP